MTANRFPTDETFSSLLTRVAPVRFDVSEDEVFAFMGEIVKGGSKVFDGRKGEVVTIPEKECRIVIEFLQERNTTNLRILKHALSIYNRFRDDGWKDLVDTVIQGSLEPHSVGKRERSSPPGVGEVSSRRKKRQDERELVGELLERDDLTTPERIALFCEETGSSRASFFRRQKELKASEGSGEGGG